MKKTRRDFLKHSSIAAAALLVPQRGVLLATPSMTTSQQIDSFFREVCILALDAARGQRATHADVRIVSGRGQFISVRDDALDEHRDTETLGIGVRALVDGAWGFASTSDVTRQDARRIAEQAVQRARDNARLNARPVELAPVEGYPEGVWRSPIRTDPFDIDVEEKADLLLTAVRAASSHSSSQSASALMSFERIEKTFASTDGSIISQTAYRSWPSLTVTAQTPDGASTHSRSTDEIFPMGLGYEYVLSSNLPERAMELAEEAHQGLSARSVEPGNYDLIVDPTNLHAVIHETLGHAAELDRALGNVNDDTAGSYLTPPESVIDSLQIGPEFMNVLCDRTQRGALATTGWDDEGVPQDSWPIIRDGVFVDYQTTREQVARLVDLTGTRHSHGCSAAASWDVMQLQRMPNVSLLPGENDLVAEDLIAATDRGIFVKGAGRCTVNSDRSNFEIGGQAFYEVRGGRIVGQLKDVVYGGSTLEFWNSMDMLGGTRGYVLGGVLDDVKGVPAQTHAVSHGCPPARFRQCAVRNTAS